MRKYEKNIITHIESVYSLLSPTEKTIADFFLHNQKRIDFSSKNVSSLLYVSEPSCPGSQRNAATKDIGNFSSTTKNGSMN